MRGVGRGGVASGDSVEMQDLPASSAFEERGSEIFVGGRGGVVVGRGSWFC